MTQRIFPRPFYTVAMVAVWGGGLVLGLGCIVAVARAGAWVWGLLDPVL